MTLATSSCHVLREMPVGWERENAKCSDMAAWVLHGISSCFLVPPLFSAMIGSSCVRSSNRCFLTFWLPIAVAWLHECCHVSLQCAYISAGWRQEDAERIGRAASMTPLPVNILPTIAHGCTSLFCLQVTKTLPSCLQQHCHCWRFACTAKSLRCVQQWVVRLV